MNTTVPNPDRLFDEIAGFIDESRKLLAQGAMMELAGMDDQVKKLCEEVTQLSKDDREKYAGRMQELLKGLQALGEEMTSKRDELAKDMRSLTDHQKANVAYRTAEGGRKKDNKE